MLENSGVELFEGVGCVDSKNTILVKGKKVTAKNILIAVGSRPDIPAFKGVEYTLTSDQYF
jgi:glutathione reductase (NADPH)